MSRDEKGSKSDSIPAEPAEMNDAPPPDAALACAIDLESRQCKADDTGRKKNSKRIDDLKDLLKQAYSFADISTYSFRDRMVIRLADLSFFLLIRIICATLRWEVKGFDSLQQIRAVSKQAIFTFWHSCIFTATYFWRNRGIIVMSSYSRDAEFTARFIQRFGYGTARGSSSRGAGRAMAQMATCLKGGVDVAFTIDGPRGPLYVAKAGSVTLARHTGQAILPFHIGISKYITLPSWDKLQIPLPFARAITLIGDPIYVPREGDEEKVASCQALLQSTLDQLRIEAENWRTKSGK